MKGARNYGCEHLKVYGVCSNDRMRELYKGGYGVTLKAMDSSRTLLGIEIMLPDSKSANKAIARWRASSADIYRYLVKVLVEDAPDVKKGNKGETEATHEEK